MKNKTTSSLIFFILTAICSFGQKDFRKGYIITPGNDTIAGQLDYRSNARNYKSCIFKNGQTEKKYYPGEIIGFGYDNDKSFLSGITEGSFAEVLVLGKISLYKSLHSYYLQKDTTLYELKTHYGKDDAAGNESHVDFNKWRGVTTYLVSDCFDNPSAVVARHSFDEKSLTSLVVRYNRCEGADYEEFKAGKPWIKHDFGMTAGLTATELYITNTPVQYAYLDASYTSLDPSFGLLVDVSSPRISEKISFQGEVHYLKSGYSSLLVLNRLSTIYHDTYINLSTLSVPLSFKYTFPEKLFSVYMQGGLNLDYHLNSETTLLTEQVTGKVVNTSPERTAFEIRAGQFGYWGGIGILKSYQKIKAGAALRYFEMPGLNRSLDFKAGSRRIMLTLILFRK